MQSNKEAAIEFVRGAAFTVLVMGGFVGVLLLVGTPEKGPVEKFKVLDSYGTCAIVRYRPENRAEDVYFLDCGNQHLN